MQSDQVQSQKVEIGGLQIGIIVLTLATAIVHLVILNLESIDILFTLNGLGFLGLLALYFLPIPIAQKNHNLVRWALMAYAAVSILAWVLVGSPSVLGFADKAIEVVLIILLWLDRG
jgi:hypothetical protein